MHRVKCRGCGRVMYESAGVCPECNWPLSSAEPTDEIPPQREEPDDDRTESTDGYLCDP